MTNKELLDKIDIMQAEVEWNYPIDYAGTFDEIKKIIIINGLLEKAVYKLCAILQDIEKDSCYYCPFGAFGKEFCVDPEERGSGYCKKEKWKEWAMKDE